MEWQPEKMCSTAGEYNLLVERFKNGYECEQVHDTWRWRVIHSGVVLSQGTAANLDTARELAESNVPLNN